MGIAWELSRVYCNYTMVGLGLDRLYFCFRGSKVMEGPLSKQSSTRSSPPWCRRSTVLLSRDTGTRSFCFERCSLGDDPNLFYGLHPKNEMGCLNEGSALFSSLCCCHQANPSKSLPLSVSLPLCLSFSATVCLVKKLKPRLPWRRTRLVVSWHAATLCQRLNSFFSFLIFFSFFASFFLFYFC